MPTTPHAPRLLLLALTVGAVSVAAQTSQPAVAERVAADDPWCESDRHDDRYARACEVVELAAPAGPLDLSAHMNGAVAVRQWDRGDVRVRARIEALASTEARAQQLLRQASVSVDGGVIRAHTPERTDRDDGWTTISFEVLTPRRTDLTVGVTNGPLTLEGLHGAIRATATNGPVSAAGLAGDVRLHAQNGPVSIALAGGSWEGAGLDVEARNGPVSVAVPAGYSARLDAATEMARVETGGLSLRDPQRARGAYVGDAVTGTLGRGGATLRLRATNGPVRLHAAE